FCFLLYIYIGFCFRLCFSGRGGGGLFYSRVIWVLVFFWLIVVVVCYCFFVWYLALNFADDFSHFNFFCV
ncbi:hypothetical protein ACNIU4_26845, partial [Escherichia coli]